MQLQKERSVNIEWLNDYIMDAAQKLILRKNSIVSTFQSVLSSQKKVTLPFKPSTQDNVQLLYVGSNHGFYFQVDV